MVHESLSLIVKLMVDIFVDKQTINTISTFNSIMKLNCDSTYVFSIGSLRIQNSNRALGTID